MKILRRILVPAALVLIAATAPAAAQESAGEQRFGAPLELDRASAATVSRVHDEAAMRGRPVVVSGTIADVCTRKGCWLVVADGERQMRVTFKDYAFFVPKDSHNRRVLLEGIVSEKEISEEDARHYAEESTSGPRPEEIVGPQTVVTMEATGVVIFDN